ncbi:MAG TPA: VCBS repeat-containing protein [Candidatus Udaeobacter sp.]|nr:VCBS repeat-containing protein [Candidatus Udaeobacter sp.]
MQHIGFSKRSTIILAGGAVLAFGPSNTNLPGQSHPPGASPAFQASVATHQTGVELQTAPGFQSTTEMAAQGEIEIPAPTRSTFMASWSSVNGALGYMLDVSTSDSFSSYVDGYHDLDVGNVTARVVAGLNRGTTYYYRVRAYGATGPASYSAVIRTTTEPTAGLIINPTFDSSITGNPNAAAIEAMINRAISFHESLFSDPITIQIRFRYSTTGPDGTPLPAHAGAQSLFVIYQVPWGIYINALRADARTSNDSVANASLPATALSPNIKPRSAGGRAVGLDTPPAMLANGTIGQGGPYDGIVTLNSSAPYQFSRPPSAGNLDAQRSTEHEVDEVIGLGSRLGHNGNDLHPQDLFSWSSPGVRNITTGGARYFSINTGATNIVSFNQNPDGDFGDWLSTACPQAHPYVQNAFGCAGQYSDIAATSPEGVNLDVVGYDLVTAARATIADFNADGHPDYVLRNPGTRQTAIWYLNNNIYQSGALGPSITAGWVLDGVADFNRDVHPDYALFNSTSDRTAIWYMSGPTRIASAYGPTLASGWELVATGDFNGNGYPDYVLYNASTHQTAIWYLNNNVYVSGGYGPTLPVNWSVVGVADFNRDGHRDYVLFNSSNHQTAIWYLSGRSLIGGAYGPSIPGGWALVATADFNSDGRPDYLLYNPASRQTAIWYLNNNAYVSAAFGPTLPAGWSLVGQ